MQKLQVHVGELMRDVLAHNERANYAPSNQDDNIPIIWPVNDTIPETFDMLYDGNGGIIRFPHARMVWVRQYAGVVTSVLVSASAEKLPLPAFYQELKSTADSFRQAGWAMNGNLPALDTMRSAIDGVATDQVQGGLLAFTNGTVSAVLTICGTVRMKWSKPQLCRTT